jgi:acyl-CoA synthetase (AMP-forming)/AMP-acid ligase II
MIDMLLAKDLFEGVPLRFLQYGAAPIHPDTLAIALAALPNTRFLQIFGQTEFSPITALDHDTHLEALAGRTELLATVGKAAPGVTIRIENPDDDGVGEIAAQGAHAFSIDADGWRRTGDLGRVDAEGFLTLHGRLNDRIVRGGENIYPIEVEQALATHPQVLEAAVVGVPDRRFGEIVKALVVPADPSVTPSVEELRAHVRERIAHFKVPAIIEFADELPRNPAGKVLRTKIPR